MRGYFVTGTDTGVGKTVVSAVLAASRGWGYWKPIQTGDESDTATVAQLTGCRVWDRGERLPDPVSPHLAARRVGKVIDLDAIVAQALATNARRFYTRLDEAKVGALAPHHRDALAWDAISRTAMR
mgnify:CR=1 FL=1